MSYEIEKGIPVVSRYKYPLNEMEVGDSFFVPCPDRVEKCRVQSIIGGTARQSRRPDHKFTTRTVLVGGVYGLRIWRIA